MKTLAPLFFLLSIHVISVAQNCDDNLGSVITATREKMITFKEPVETKSEKAKTLSFFGGVQEKTVILAMTFVDNYGATSCVNSGAKIVFEFEDGTDIKLKNGFDTNCSGTSAVYFSEKKENLAEFDQVLTKTLSRVKITFRDLTRKIDVTREESKLLSQNLRCIYAHLNDTPVFVAHSIPTAISTGSPEAPRPYQVRSDSSKVYLVVESLPEYEGGYEKMMEFIRVNMRYPAVARRYGYQGTVFVSFVVQRDGTVVDAKVIRGVHESLDEEAVRVVNLMPKWKPGTQSGEPVNVRFNLPVKFKLNDNLVIKRRQVN